MVMEEIILRLSVAIGLRGPLIFFDQWMIFLLRLLWDRVFDRKGVSIQ